MSWLVLLVLAKLIYLPNPPSRLKTMFAEPQGYFHLTCCLIFTHGLADMPADLPTNKQQSLNCQVGSVSIFTKPTQWLSGKSHMTSWKSLIWDFPLKKPSMASSGHVWVGEDGYLPIFRSYLITIPFMNYEWIKMPLFHYISNFTTIVG